MDKQHTNECIHIMYALLILYYSNVFIFIVYTGVYGVRSIMLWGGRVGFRLNANLIVCLMPSAVH